MLRTVQPLPTPSAVASSLAAAISLVAASIAGPPVEAQTVRAGPVINELLYDPAGADDGREFVELLNTGPQAVSLAGWVLEAGNGARAGDWRAQWRGEAQDRLEPGAYFLIAGPLWEGVADARVDLALQNGPDAVRLCSSQEVVDRIGWGAHVHAEYYEGAPAPDVPSGWVLARHPDGQDSDRNGEDLVASAHPTPGASNTPDWAAQVGAIACEPPLLELAVEGHLSAEISNLGQQPLPLRGVCCRAAGRAIAIPDSAGPDELLPAGESRRIRWRLQPRAEGVEIVRLSLSLPDGSRVGADLRVRVGHGPVLVSEICYDPAADEGEWIELANLGSQTLDLAGWRLADGSGRVTFLGPDRVPLASGARIVVAEDRAAFLRAWPQLAGEQLAARQGGWPGLNNTLDRELGFADQVLVSDVDGLPSDCVRYVPGDLDGSGVTLERWIEDGRLIDAHLLIPCAEPAGASPGRSSWRAGQGPSGTGWMQPDPALFFPDRDGEARFCRIAIPASSGGDREVGADVFSLAGVRVATLSAGARQVGPLVLAWDGCDASGAPLPTGLYIIRILAGSPPAGREDWLRAVALVRG